MNIRPFRDIRRKKTKKINVGKVEVGGDAPISVQSMTNTLTTDVDKTIKQINELTEAGADIVRVSCPDQDSSLSLKKILKYVNVPIVADIHFHYKRAIECANSGASCLRINPGNIGSKEKVYEILKAAKDNNCSIRIGVNAGSLEKDLLEKYKEPCPEALCESALRNIKILEDKDFLNSINIAKWHIYAASLVDCTFFCFSYLYKERNFSKIEEANRIFFEILNTEKANGMNPEAYENVTKEFNSRYLQHVCEITGYIYIPRNLLFFIQ